MLFATSHVYISKKVSICSAFAELTFLLLNEFVHLLGKMLTGRRSDYSHACSPGAEHASYDSVLCTFRTSSFHPFFTFGTAAITTTAAYSATLPSKPAQLRSTPINTVVSQMATVWSATQQAFLRPGVRATAAVQL